MTPDQLLSPFTSKLSDGILVKIESSKAGKIRASSSSTARHTELILSRALSSLPCAEKAAVEFTVAQNNSANHVQMEELCPEVTTLVDHYMLKLKFLTQ